MGRTKHGKCDTRIYVNWAGMLARCRNPNHEKYPDYGGRGIKVCDEWKDFRAFYRDMGEIPSDTHSIDRIDVNGNYEPSNCKWATVAEQSVNKRTYKNNTTGTKGVRKMGAKWQARIRVNKIMIYLGTFIDIEDAIKARKEAEIIYHQKSS